MLGKSFEDFKNILGGSIKIVENKKGKRIIDGTVNLKFQNEILTEFSIIEGGICTYQDLDVFSENFADELKKKQSSVYKYGFLIFNEVGIALSGFVEKEEQKTITVYSKGAWDAVMNS